MKLSKRILLAVVAMSMAASVVAQNITFTHGDKTNGKGLVPSDIIIDKGDAEDVYYSIEPELTILGGIKSVMVREVNLNYKESKCLKIANTKHFDVLHAQREGSKMHLLVYSNVDDLFVLRQITVDLKSFSVKEDKTLFDVTIDKHVFFYHWDAESPSGNYYAFVFALVNEKVGTASVKAYLFNKSSMERQWEKILDVPAITNVFVTDDGRIVTGGFSNGDDKDDGAVLAFSIVSEDDVVDARFSSTSKVGELALLNCYGDKVLATFLETERGVGLVTGVTVTKGNVYTGCVSFLVDVANGKVMGSDHRAFSKEEARVFYAASLMSEITSADVNFLSCRASATTTYGGVAVYGRTWKEHVTQSNGMTFDKYQFKGMMLFGVDSTGHFTWVRPLMHDNAVGSTISASRTETDLVAEGDMVYLITNESDKDLPDYDPEKPAKKAVTKPHGAVVAYSFTADGKVSKQMLEPKGTNIIMTRLRRQAPGVYTFITAKTKGCVSEINIKL